MSAGSQTQEEDRAPGQRHGHGQEEGTKQPSDNHTCQWDENERFKNAGYPLGQLAGNED